MSNIEETLLLIFRAVFNDPGLVLSRDIVAGQIPEWDSFKNVEILLACEEKFKIRFRSKEINLVRTIGDLLDLIDLKLKSAS